MNRGRCNCLACTAYRNQDDFCEWCDEACCYECAEFRGAFNVLDLLCKDCDELSCMRCGDEREYPYAGKRFIVYALESGA